MKLKKARLVEEFLNVDAKLPYGLQPAHIKQTITSLYDFLYHLNTFLLSRGYSRIEDLILGNSFSGILSELIVKEIAKCAPTLDRNIMVGGHPDLLPKGRYKGNRVLKGKAGIEVKTSRQPGGWQGHNPEKCWLIVFRYSLDDHNCPPEKKEPLAFVQVLAASMDKKDWSFSGRNATSRRTITASITSSGMDKLRCNPLYQNPASIVAPNEKLRKKYEKIFSGRAASN